MLYTAYEAQNALLAPARAASSLTLGSVRASPQAFHRPLRRVSAWHEVLGGVKLTHTRPAYGIDSVLIDGEAVGVSEREVLTTPFATLRRFATESADPKPAVLLVAALSGHFATLLRPTVRALLQDHDVYITDWHNARDVDLADGPFGVDEYVEHLIKFIRFIGPDTHVLAVCQPCGPALMATAALAQAGEEIQPKTLTLMAGPVDARVNPTKMNEMTTGRSLDWYRKRCITTVPGKWNGAGRRVYPGFLQVTAFMSMNMRRHIDSHVQMYRKFVSNDVEGAAVTKEFYREYFAVLDIAEEFYLETVDAFFMRHLLARGEMYFDGNLVEPAAIQRTALLTVEAANDDMCAPGQTEAAHALVTGLRDDQRAHHLQADVGHYGIFAGRRWENEVYPVVRDFIAAHA